MIEIEIWDAAGQVAEYTAEAVPRVGDTVMLAGARRGERTVVRVNWCVYVVKDSHIAQLEIVRVIVQ